MGKRQVRYPWLTDVLATTDATPTVSTACSYAPPTGTSGHVRVRASIYGTATVAFVEKVYPFRNASGVLTLLTAIPVVAIGGDAGILAVVVDVTTSGTTVQPRVTGIAVTNLSTVLDCQYTLD